MKYGIVTTNLLDLWSAPKYQSERVTQLLWGEGVTVLAQKAGFAKIRQQDGYRGWADIRFLTPVTGATIRARRDGTNAVIALAKAPIRTPSRSPVAPFFLYYGTPVCARNVSRGQVRVTAPNGDRLLLSKSSIRPIMKNKGPSINGTRLVQEARKFLGTPYLWGGISPAGFDCSGFVRALFGTFGILLPRDTCDQIKVGQPIERSEVRAGDLLFFNRHVGLACACDKMIHTSVGGGGVRINGIRAGMTNYRRDLDLDFKLARRVI